MLLCRCVVRRSGRGGKDVCEKKEGGEGVERQCRTLSQRAANRVNIFRGWRRRQGMGRRENKSRRVSGIPDPSYVAPLCKMPKWLSRRRRRPARSKIFVVESSWGQIEFVSPPPYRSEIMKDKKRLRPFLHKYRCLFDTVEIYNSKHDWNGNEFLENRLISLERDENFVEERKPVGPEFFETSMLRSRKEEKERLGKRFMARFIRDKYTVANRNRKYCVIRSHENPVRNIWKIISISF